MLSGFCFIFDSQINQTHVLDPSTFVGNIIFWYALNIPVTFCVYDVKWKQFSTGTIQIAVEVEIAPAQKENKCKNNDISLLRTSTPISPFISWTEFKSYPKFNLLLEIT